LEEFQQFPEKVLDNKTRKNSINEASEGRLFSED